MNDIIAKVTPNDLDLLYQGKKFEILLSLKVRASTTCEMTLCTSHFLHRFSFLSANEH